MKQLWAVEYIDDDGNSYIQTVFDDHTQAEKYSKYRMWREEFEWHKEMWNRPAHFQPTDLYFHDSADEAIADFEDVYGPPVAGDIALQQKHEHEKEEGKRHEFIMINKTQWEEFKEWQKNNQSE